jgi:DNA adenine methylase
MLNTEKILVPPQPFLRWAGGKRKLVDSLVRSFPSSFANSKNDFYEPFVGGGALMLALGDKGLPVYVSGNRLLINDSNPDLVATYITIRDDAQTLIKKLEVLARDVSKKAFLRVRADHPRDDVSRAARFIYLNKTCFNGLWRVNSKGEFNVPYGQLKNPKILDSENLWAVHARLQGTHISTGPYQSALERAQKGDLVYLDPPYIPLSASSSFSKYAKEDFGILDQYALAGVIDGLTSRGVYVILSNSDTPLTRKIFGDSLALHQITVQRTISAKASSRKPVNEVIGTNFPTASSSHLRNLKIVS